MKEYNQKITVYVTKYALTSGIKKCIGEDISDKYDKKYFRGITDGGVYNDYYHGSEFHYTEEEALKDAESRRLRKIESLKKQISKLEKLKF